MQHICNVYASEQRFARVAMVVVVGFVAGLLLMVVVARVSGDCAVVLVIIVFVCLLIQSVAAGCTLYISRRAFKCTNQVDHNTPRRCVYD